MKVISVHPSPPEFLRQQVCDARIQQLRLISPQILCVLEDIPVQAIKTGMLFDATLTRVVVETLTQHYAGNVVPPLVCDPVCVATSGDSLLDPSAIDVLIRDLLPLASIVTPNKSEAERLLSHGRTEAYASVETPQDMLAACDALLALGLKAVLLKGGHMTVSMADVTRLARAHPEMRVVLDAPFGDNMEILQLNRNMAEDDAIVVDMLKASDTDFVALFVRPWVNSTSTHGTGCTLSAAIASGLANGLPCQCSPNALKRTYADGQ